MAISQTATLLYDSVHRRSMTEKRRSIKEVLNELNTVVDVDKIYPTEDSSKIGLSELKTIGMQLSASQAPELASYLTLAVSAGWKTIDITGYRETKNSNSQRGSQSNYYIFPPVSITIIKKFRFGLQ